MKKIIIIVTLFFSTWVASAQNGSKIIETIKGKVINVATNEPVAYTNIGLEGTLYGTASNADGDFELKIPEELASKNIYFSAVGFKNKTFPVTELYGKEYSVIKLESQSYDIGNIDVAAQSKVLIRILRMAAENTPYNFIGGPYNLICSYENNKTTNDTTQTNQKASVTIYDKSGYTNPSKLDAFQSVKYVVKKDSEYETDYRFSTGTNNIGELLDFDWVRSGSSVLNPDLLADFRLTLEDEPVVNGDECWTIAFKQTVPTLAGSGDFYATFFEGKITIEKEDYSVKKIEGTIRSKQNSLQGRSLAVTNSSLKVKKDVSYQYTVSYANLKPELIQVEKKYKMDGSKIQEQISLKVNQVQTTNVTALQNRDYFSGE
ncbi:carboxypeptidase-like regulatory domain-containing protein [Maribellus maritimus]|uniref:carboxypeptidase-like regulatory domain-containing protein n=1 Tax=Maribellus maritimus TaxID=2870838 RepID=UPI001EEB8198|nr:carboxypeptidase-like regulatory domain-containing protein [Maribellus maritimus]MCG6188703.1 carboxypeptidase-like regulatory domain-containing protein [Maribellus maritimus]